MNRGGMSRKIVIDEDGNNPLVDRDYYMAMLLGTTRTGKSVYEGTADPVVVAKRRAANKVARRQRKLNK